jgi:hypothetical protein
MRTESIFGDAVVPQVDFPWRLISRQFLPSALSKSLPPAFGRRRSMGPQWLRANIDSVIDRKLFAVCLVCQKAV